MDHTDPLPPCGLLRRTGAMVYDGILLFAVLFLATALLLPFTHGAAIKSGNYFYLGYLLLISYLYFACCSASSLIVRSILRSIRK